ncbi:MAG: DUF4437 domain-containing protein [Pseudomonadota bacterium]
MRCPDGLSSLPHVHNITHRAVEIGGELHNDAPSAALFWMPPGSFWIQSADENHITAARPGSGATAFSGDSLPDICHAHEVGIGQSDRGSRLSAGARYWGNS